MPDGLPAIGRLLYYNSLFKTGAVVNSLAKTIAEN
jgi:hypothetical protein